MRWTSLTLLRDLHKFTHEPHLLFQLCTRECFIYIFIYLFNDSCSFHNISAFDMNLSCFLFNAILRAFHITDSKPMRTQLLDTNIQHNFLQRGHNRYVCIYKRKLVNRWIQIKNFKPLYASDVFSEVAQTEITNRLHHCVSSWRPLVWLGHSW